MSGKKIAVLVMGLIFSLGAFASEPAKRDSVEKLLELTEASKMVDTMYAQMENMFAGMANQMGVTEKNRPAYDKYMKKVFAVINEDMSWKKMKEPLVQIYIKHLTEEEVQGMIDFYSTDIGKSMIKKMPIIMQDSMGLGQQMMVNALPKIKVLAEEMAAEVRAENAKPTENTKPAENPKQ